MRGQAKVLTAVGLPERGRDGQAGEADRSALWATSASPLVVHRSPNGQGGHGRRLASPGRRWRRRRGRGSTPLAPRPRAPTTPPNLHGRLHPQETARTATRSSAYAHARCRATGLWGPHLAATSRIKPDGADGHGRHLRRPQGDPGPRRRDHGDAKFQSTSGPARRSPSRTAVATPPSRSCKGSAALLMPGPGRPVRRRRVRRHHHVSRGVDRHGGRTPSPPTNPIYKTLK